MLQALRSIGAIGILGLAVLVAPSPTQAQMSGLCMIPEVQPYPNAQPASMAMLGMRAGMAHNVTIWSTSDDLSRVIEYYRTTLGPQGFMDTATANSMPQSNQTTNSNVSTGITSAEFSKDGNQFVYIESSGPGFMLALGCG
jgi:hypothetical protein